MEMWKGPSSNGTWVWFERHLVVGGTWEMMEGCVSVCMCVCMCASS